MPKSLLSNISAFAVTTGVVCVIIWKTWKWFKWRTVISIEKDGNRSEENICHYNFDINQAAIIIVDSSEQWEEAYKQLEETLAPKKVVGMDCEWVQKNKVALLQICSTTGFCMLVRLFKLQPPYPKSLVTFLADRSILKTGVAIVDDGSKLLQDYGLCVRGCIDLRYLLHRLRIKSHANGLKALASKILGVDISKDPAIRCSNWEAECYSEQQINYAATDAAVAVEIFTALVLEKMKMSGRGLLQSSIDSCKKDKTTHSVKDTDEKQTQEFSSGSDPNISRDDSINKSENEEIENTSFADQETSLQEHNYEPEENSENIQVCEEDSGNELKAVDEMDVQYWKMACSLCQGLVDVNYTHKNKGDPQSGGMKKSVSKKSTTASYSTRQRPLWDNCRLQAPDGSVLCTCDVKKAQWYLDKELGDKVCDDPFTVRLRFEPSNRPQDERNYYLQEKENHCVVCGHDKEYVRKFVIPFEYKKFFPSALKDHSSHDVLLLCINCHRRSCEFDSRLRLQLAEECDAPVESGATAKTVMDHDLQKVRSAGRALQINRNSIPENRIKELEQALLDHFGVDVVSDDLIQRAAEVDARQTADGYVPHGKRVVQHMARNGGLLAFQSRWRQHFLDSMNPQFLPAYWSVDYVPEGWSTLQMSS